MTPTNKNVLIDREKYVGSSEISTIMGINHFKTRFNLLLEKAGLQEPEIVENEYVEFGSKIEKYIRDYINKDYEDKFKEDTIIKDHDILKLRTNYDGLNSDTALEIKSTSIIHDDINDYKYYLVQLLYGMMLANVDKGILAVYKRNDNFEVVFDAKRLQIFHVNIDDYKDLCVEIMEEIEKFCIDLKKLKENPFLTEEELIDNSVVSLSKEVIKLEKQLQSYDELKKKYENFKSKLKTAMEENGVKHWDTPNGTKITLVEDTPDKEVEEEYYDEDRFMQENIDLFQNYHNKLAEYKETRKILKKGKKGYIKITLGKEND